MDKVRIGVIGAGQIAQHHFDSYASMKEVELVAVADLLPERVEEAQKKYGFAHGYSDFKELLKRDDIDAVDVCVHNNKHAPVTMAVLRAGKHAYCEKPMAGTYRDAENMINTAQELGRMLHIQMATVYSIETHAAERLIAEGLLGEIYHARSFGYRRRGRPYVDGYGSTSFVNKAISAGGAMFDMGIYHLAQMLHLLGNPVVKTVTGTTHQHLDMYEDRRERSHYSVEEMGLGWVRFDNGISFDIEETWAGHQDGAESSKILGSRGGLRLDPLAFFGSMADMAYTAKFDLGSAEARWRACKPETRWYESSQRHWVGALLGRVELLPTARYGQNAALISEGIYLSTAQGRELTADQIREQSKSTAIDPYTPEDSQRDS